MFIVFVIENVRVGGVGERENARVRGVGLCVGKRGTQGICA